MKTGTRVKLSAIGRELSHLFPNPEIKGTVVRPGRTRGGMRLAVVVDGQKKPVSYRADYWTTEAA